MLLSSAGVVLHLVSVTQFDGIDIVARARSSQEYKQSEPTLHLFRRGLPVATTIDLLARRRYY